MPVMRASAAARWRPATAPAASTTSGCVRARSGSSRRWPCTATTRRRCTSSCRWTSPDVRQSRLVKKNLFIKSSRGIDTVGARCWKARAPIPPPPARRPSTRPPRRRSARWPNGTASSAQDHAADGQPAGRGQHPAAGLRAAPGGRRRRGRVRHLPRRRRICAWRTPPWAAGGRIESVGNSRSALGPCMGLGGRSDLDIRGPEWSADGHQAGVRRARGRRAAAWTCGCWRPGAGRPLPQADQRQRPHAGRGAGAQLRSGVRPRRQPGVRLHPAGQPDAEAHACPTPTFTGLGRT